MTKTEAIRAAKAMGMDARRTEYGEIRVTFPVRNLSTALDLTIEKARDRAERMAYYTDDALDAFHTAHAMKVRGY